MGNPAVDTKLVFHGSLIERRSLLDNIQVNYGPASVLGRFFLAAEKTIRDMGIALELSSLGDIAQVQAGNKTSWTLFPPMLDVRLSPISPAASYALIGRNSSGDIVCAQGGRIYDTGRNSLQDIVDDQSFFYADGRAPSLGEPQIVLTAPSAVKIRGTFVYSGALWVRPDFRGQELSRLLPRLSRAYALANWDTKYTIALVSNQIANSPLLAMYGYSKVEPEFRISGLMDKPMIGSLMWMDTDELAFDLSHFLALSQSQINATVTDGRTKNDQSTIRPADWQRQA
jgi:hypothetical protein